MSSKPADSRNNNTSDDQAAPTLTAVLSLYPLNLAILPSYTIATTLVPPLTQVTPDPVDHSLAAEYQSDLRASLIPSTTVTLLNLSLDDLQPTLFLDPLHIHTQAFHGPPFTQTTLTDVTQPLTQLLLIELPPEPTYSVPVGTQTFAEIPAADILCTPEAPELIKDEDPQDPQDRARDKKKAPVKKKKIRYPSVTPIRTLNAEPDGIFHDETGNAQFVPDPG